MNELKAQIDLLKNNSRTLYSSDEVSEILYSLYTSIYIALQLNADILIVAPLQVKYLDSENKVIKLPHEEVTQVDRTSNIEVLDFIISKDKLVASLLRLISRDNNEVRFKIEVADFVRKKTESV